MSKKKLDRTAIEGGRTGGYKIERKKSLRDERHQAKGKLHDADGSDDPVFGKRKRTSYWVDEKFKDKLSPVERWLDSQLGKSWDKTYSLMREKFDDRSTPGRHILFDHMLNQINRTGEREAGYFPYYRYYVDDHGILRKNPKSTYSRSNWKAIVEERVKIGEWLQGRLVGKIGEVLYWFEATTSTPNPISCVWKWDGLYFVYQTKVGTSRWYPRYRQGKRLEGKDVEFFSKLQDSNKEDLLKYSPQNKRYDDFEHFYSYLR